MTDRILKKIGTYCAQADFQPEIIGRVSLAAKSLCMWVRAMEVYGRIYRVVEPKKQRLAQATSQLQEKQAVLADAKAKLKEVGMVRRRSQDSQLIFLTERSMLFLKVNAIIGYQAFRNGRYHICSSLG